MVQRCPSSQASTRPSSAGELLPPPPPPPPQHSQFYRTKICPFHLKHQLRNPRYKGLFAVNVGCPEGTCATGGIECRFAHSLRELRPLPDLTRTKLCASYQRQVPCTIPDCPFAHSPQDLRTSSSVFYKVSLCNFYKNNKCWNGENCRFAHGNQELREHLEMIRGPQQGKKPGKGRNENKSDPLADFSRALTPGTSATPGCSWALNRTDPHAVVPRTRDVHPSLKKKEGTDSLNTTTEAEVRFSSLAEIASAEFYTSQNNDEPSIGGFDDAAEALIRYVLELDD